MKIWNIGRLNIIDENTKVRVHPLQNEWTCVQCTKRSNKLTDCYGVRISSFNLMHFSLILCSEECDKEWEAKNKKRDDYKFQKSFEEIEREEAKKEKEIKKKYDELRESTKEIMSQMILLSKKERYFIFNELSKEFNLFKNKQEAKDYLMRLANG